MECNKDEAIRSKEIAEKKMENNDFEGARKFAKKAQNLYPELENITQLLTVCDVHCSSQKRVLGSEKDWYEILQVERLADELIIKKQYRRLALFLHPDKNRFPGAEAAFKLICEANNVLSDPGKKSLYDSKIRVSVRSTPVNPPTHHITKNSHFNNIHRAPKNALNGFSSLNPNHAAESSSSVMQERFWTCCSFCKVKFQYERRYVNKYLRCQQCLKPFWAHEISPRGVPLGSKGGQPAAHPMSSKASWSQPAGFQEKGIPNQANFKMGVKNDTGVSASHVSQDNASRKTVQQEPQNQAGSGSGGFWTESAAKNSRDSKVKETDFCDVNLSHGEKETGTSHGDAITREIGDLKNRGRKRGRKQVIESSESFDASSEYDVEDAATRENFDAAAIEMDSVPPGVHLMQRSTRKRQHVMYNENGNDFAFPLKGAKARNIPNDGGKEQKDALDAVDAQHNPSNGFSSLNPNQATGLSSSVRQACFWTCCSYCKMEYQHERKFVNKYLRCKQCLKPFCAREISPRGVPLGSKGGQPVAHPMFSKAGSSQPGSFQEKGIPNQADFKMGVKNDKGISVSHASQDNASRKTVQQAPQNHAGSGSGGFQTESAAKISRNSKVKETNFRDVNLSRGEKEAGTSHDDAITREAGNLKNKGRKRGRKQVIESCVSFDTSSEYEKEDVTMRENFGDAATEMDSESPGVHVIQRTTRKRQHIKYNENGGDFAFCRKGAQARKLPDDSGKKHKDALDAEDSIHGNQNSFPTDGDNSRSGRKQMGTVHPEGGLQCKGADGVEEFKVRRETAVRPCTDAGKVEVESDSDEDSHSSDDSNADLCECPDAEFSDFNKYRDDNRFAVNQIWACYDTLDGMPRFYAKVRKISKSPFELSFTWFEADPKDETHMKWVERELPVGCGSFRLGKTEKTARRLSFSHQMHCANGQKRGSFIFYPRKGEVWAIFKDWDMSWSSNPENRVFKYEIVEVLSDFVAGSGIKVGYLDKIIGFLSLFQRISPSKTDTILIGPSHLYKFSHRIPCCKMTGTERAGVPKDSFELDPASLPLNPDDLYYPSKCKMECGNLDPGVNSSPADSAMKNGRSVVPEGTSGPKEYVDSEGIDGKVSERRRSTRGMNLNRQKGN